MTRALRAGVCVLWALSACNVASVQEQKSTIAQNQCASDSDCPGGSCDSKLEQCRTTNGSFDTMLFEVTPPADATSIAGVQFLKSETNLPKTGGELDLELGLLAVVSGEVTLLPRDCVPKFQGNQGQPLATAGDGSVPAFVSLVPSSGALGLFASPASAEAMVKDSSNFLFSVSVPPGQYDIYVQPQQQPDDSCVVPPELLRGQVINAGALNLNIALPVPSTFDLHVSWPLGDGGLDGWVVDMLDPISGSVISNSAPLALEKGGLSYLASLSYFPVVGDTSKVKADELVRLSPPSGVTAPSVLLSRGALGLFSANSGTLSQFTSLPTVVNVEGQVTAQATPNPSPAAVTLIATSITGVDPGVLASFVRTATAGNDGRFDVDLLPGTYRVSAVPGGASGINNSELSNTGLADATAEWVVAASPSTQAGKLIELPKTLTINGTVFDSAHTPLAGAQVQATASPDSVMTDVLHVALGETAFVPRASNGSVQSNGSFALSTDSGTFDFSVRPQASTGFAWLVIPGLGVGTMPATSAGPTLNDIIAPLPVSYTGQLTALTPAFATPQPVPGALIRTFIYMSGGAYTADPTQADSLLQIAETRCDDNGVYELLIPASLNKAPN
ncbi:MAG TPA: hypothetical protein VK745_12610 [Polyangiaceae bacterium]|jgi:hypothetical protein|nr:hypothetical protein [Polyangiaceae bacterium]